MTDSEELKLKFLAFVPNLDEQTKEYCRGPLTPANPRGAREGKFDYFHQGFVDLNIPRDSAYTEDIGIATEGFAIADSKGRVLPDAKFSKDQRKLAEKAIAGAKITFNVDVQVPQEHIVKSDARAVATA